MKKRAIMTKYSYYGALLYGWRRSVRWTYRLPLPMSMKAAVFLEAEDEYG